MTRFIEGRDRGQATLFPERIDEVIEAANPVRVVDAYVDALDLAALGFDVEPETTGRPGYHPATMLKIYLYGYISQGCAADARHRNTQGEARPSVGDRSPDARIR